MTTPARPRWIGSAGLGPPIRIDPILKPGGGVRHLVHLDPADARRYVAAVRPVVPMVERASGPWVMANRARVTPGGLRPGGLARGPGSVPGRDPIAPRRRRVGLPRGRGGLLRVHRVVNRRVGLTAAGPRRRRRRPHRRHPGGPATARGSRSPGRPGCVRDPEQRGAPRGRSRLHEGGVDLPPVGRRRGGLRPGPGGRDTRPRRVPSGPRAPRPSGERGQDDGRRPRRRSDPVARFGDLPRHRDRP